MIQYFLDLAQQFSQPITAIAQIVGFVQMFLGFFVFRDISRRATIGIKILCDALSAIHFALLGQWTGGVICSINIGRGICFSQKDRKKWATGIYMPILFCLLTIGGSLLGWTGTISLLPMVGSCLAVVGYWCRDTRYLRLLNLVGISCWLVYSVLVLSISTMISNLVYIVSILITMIRVALANRKAENS